MNNVFFRDCFSVLQQCRILGSLVFYNSFLPDIATPDKQDALSAKGYVYGYIGSIILVVICLALIMFFADTPKEALFIH